MERERSRNKRKRNHEPSWDERKQDCIDLMREVEEYQLFVKAEYHMDVWFQIIHVHSDGIELRAETYTDAGPIFLKLRCFPPSPAVFRPDTNTYYPCITSKELDRLRDMVAMQKEAEVAEELPWLLEGLPWLLDDLWKIVTQYF